MRHHVEAARDAGVHLGYLSANSAYWQIRLQPSWHARSPPGIEVLAASPWTSLTSPSTHGVAHMSLYTAASGVLVFATGTIQWAWGLNDFNAPALRSRRTSPAAQQITRNVLARFRETPNQHLT